MAGICISRKLRIKGSCSCALVLQPWMCWKIVHSHWIIFSEPDSSCLSDCYLPAIPVTATCNTNNTWNTLCEGIFQRSLIICLVALPDWLFMHTPLCLSFHQDLQLFSYHFRICYVSSTAKGRSIPSILVGRLNLPLLGDRQSHLNPYTHSVFQTEKMFFIFQYHEDNIHDQYLEEVFLVYHNYI